MRRWLWIDGRFAWPVIGAVVFFTLSLLAVDLAWRLVKLQFDALLLYAAAAEAAAIGAIILGIYLLRRRS